MLNKQRYICNIIQSQRMKVSVIIPAYNEEKCIIAIIKAIIVQSYIDYEVIIVDNNSTDSTWVKTTKYLSSIYPKNVVNNEDDFRCDISGINFHVVKEYERGTNNAREKGRSIATGEILAFADADCMPYPDWISSGVNLFKSRNVAAASGAYFFYDDTIIRSFISLYTQILLYKPISYILQLFNRGGIINGGNIFILSNVFNKLGGFNTDLSFYGDDVDTAIRASKCGKVLFSTYITMPTSSRRFKELGYSKTNKKNISVYLKMIFGKSFSAEESKETVHPR